MNKIVITLVGAAALAGSVVALAGGVDQAPAAKQGGFYMGADLGYANTPNGFRKISAAAKSDLNAAGISQENSGLTFGFHAGYDFNKYVALEGGYIRLPKVGYKDKNNLIGKNDFVGHENNNVAYAAVKGMYPFLNDKLDVFAKVGYAAIFSNSGADFSVNGTTYQVSGTSETYYDPLVGAGVEYKVLPSVGINAQYTALIDAGKNYPTTHLVTAGLNYYF